MFRYALACIMLLIFSQPFAASQKEWLAVNPFKADKILKTQAQQASDHFRQAFINTKYFYVKQSATQAKALAKIQASDVVAYEKGELSGSVRLGKRLQVSRLLTGQLKQDTQNIFHLDISLVDVIRGVEIYQNTLKSKSWVTLIEKIDAEVTAMNKLAKLSAKVLSHQGNQVNVSLTRLDPIAEGQVLAIYRQKGQVLLPIGKAVIRSILDSQSIADIIEKEPDYAIKIDDIVKLSEYKTSETRLGQLKVDVNTSWVTLEIDGIKQADPLMEEQVAFFSLSEGPHKLVFYKQGFMSEFGEQKIEKEMDVKLSEEQLITIAFEPVPAVVKEKIASKNADIKFSTDPPNAHIFVDGIDYGKEGFVEGLSLGEHTLVFKKYLYHEKKMRISLKEAGIQNLGLIKLKANFAVLKIDSVPEGAEILLNNEIIGKTPYTQKFKSGSYDITLRKDLYYEKKIQVILKDDQQLAQSFSLDPHFGTLLLQVVPNNSEVKIDGKYYGKISNHKPLKIERLKSIKHKISVSHPHYESQTRYVLLKDGQTQLESIKLKPIYANLSITGVPKGSSVYLNDEKIGQTPMVKHKVDQGFYRLHIKPKNKGRYFEFKKDIQVVAQKDLQFKDNLKVKKADLNVYVYKKNKVVPANVGLLIDGEEYKGVAPFTFKDLPCDAYKLHVEYNNEIKEGAYKVVFQAANKYKFYFDRDSEKKKKYFLGLALLFPEEDTHHAIKSNGLNISFDDGLFAKQDLIIAAGMLRGEKHFRQRLGLKLINNKLAGKVSEGSLTHAFNYHKMALLGFASMDYHFSINKPLDIFIGAGFNAGLMNHDLEVLEKTAQNNKHHSEDIRGFAFGFNIYTGFDWARYSFECGYGFLGDSGGSAKPVILSSYKVLDMNTQSIAGLYFKTLYHF
eukprot:COSAG01_NODE_814_length_13398_cov_4.254230_9_plen_899_part_00